MDSSVSVNINFFKDICRGSLMRRASIDAGGWLIILIFNAVKDSQLECLFVVWRLCTRGSRDDDQSVCACVCGRSTCHLIVYVLFSVFNFYSVSLWVHIVVIVVHLTHASFVSKHSKLVNVDGRAKNGMHSWYAVLDIYRVGQIKPCHFTFLLVTNECIYQILWFLAHINYIKQQVAQCQFYVNEYVTL